MKRFVVIAASALMLTACGATSPSYQALDGRTGGYASQPIESNRYVVSYTGVKGMPKEQVAKYAMLRAAEVTQESGNEWFAVVSTTTRKVDLTKALSSAIGADGHFLDTGFSFGGWGGGAPPAQVLERWKPDDVAQTIMIIQVGSGDDARFPGLTTTPEIFDAKSTTEEIRGS